MSGSEDECPLCGAFEAQLLELHPSGPDADPPAKPTFDNDDDD